MLRSRWPLLIPAILVLPYGIYLWFTTLGPSNVFAVLAGLTLVLALIGLWWSVRGTLAAAEDAALDLSSESREREALLETKRTLLRALKDLEHERAVGKLDERDYERLSASYRASAKEVLEQLDQDLGPYLERARILAGGADVHGRAYTRKAPATQDATSARDAAPSDPDGAAVAEPSETDGADEPSAAEDANDSAADERADEGEREENEAARGEAGEPPSPSPAPGADDARARALAVKLAGLSDDKRREAEAFLAKLAEQPEDDA